MKKIEIPKHVKLIIDILEHNGYEAYAVGGCVRDAIIGREPNDWDITTSAMPEDVKRIFNKTIDTGIKHGTITVMIEKVGYEITTYRIDGEYEDGRHPKQVAFTGSLVEDLRRRDFTINAMAYNDRNGIVDEFDGIGDLKRGVIRCVGNPMHRFTEDALRILRAVRFAAVLDFTIEEHTREAVVLLAENLCMISKERIQAELEKLIMSGHPEKIKTACETGITKVIFEEMDRLNTEGKLEEVLNLVCVMPKNHYLRWAALLIESGRERAANILKGFKFDNKTVNIVSRLVEAVRRKLPDSRADVRRDIYEIGEDIYELYLEFLKVYLKDPTYIDAGDFYDHEKIRREYLSILETGECISLKGLAVNGKDLVELGAERGKQVGEGLNMLLYKVLENEKLNERETLIDIFTNTYS
ncbi:MAG: CCA tRNA nucleotidyltransferase [Lachnospiraceae bacterium]|nr:CCA tRNA nucleotidyltransferase [Lachnospiraceae bacterium]